MATVIRLKQIESGSQLAQVASGSGQGMGFPFAGDAVITGSLFVSGANSSGTSFTASLQEGYAWVGDANNISTLVSTASFGGGGNANNDGQQYYVGVFTNTTDLITGSIYDEGNFTAVGTTVPNDPDNIERFLVDAGQTNSYNLIIGQAEINNYLQFNLRNALDGVSSSGDFVVTNDAGNETINYIDLGINSSQYALEGGVGGANDAYLYSTGQHLHIGNATEGNHVTIFAGGLDSMANQKLLIDSNNQHELTGSLNVSGGMFISGTLDINSLGEMNYIRGPITASDTIHIDKIQSEVALTTQGRILYSNYFADTASLPPATQYHGMFTHVHSGGQALFSHGNNGWIRLYDQRGFPGLISGSQVPAFATASLYPTTVSASAWISASQIHAKQVVVDSGALELKAAEDPGSGEPLSAFLFVSESLSGGKDLWYRNNGVLYNQSWLQGTLETGLIYGGIVTFTSSVTDTPPFQTELRITPGAGLIVDHNASTSSFALQTPKYVNFGAITASAQFITSSQVTYLLIDENGQLEQQTTPYTAQQYTNKFPLGYIFCLTTSSITSYADARVTTYAQSEQGSEFIRAFGPLKISGFDITPQSGSLKVSIASGRTYRYGGFYSQNPDSPSIYDSNAIPTGSLVRVKRDPSAIGGYRAITNGGMPFTDIDPTKWDDGSGTLQTVGSDEWTIQRVFQGVVQNVSYVYYGQNTYSSLALALQAITTDSFAESPTSILALPFIGFIVTRGNATDLADSTDNRVIQAGLFRNTAGSSGGGGGAAAQNINDLADVNITSPFNGQGLVYNSGLWINGNPTSASYADYAGITTNSTSASVAISASYAVSASNAVSASYASRIGKEIVNTIPFIATAGQTVKITSIPSSIDEVGTELRTKVDLSNASSCDTVARIQENTSALVGELYFQYSTDENTWYTLNSNKVDLGVTGTQITAKESIPAGAKTSSTIVRLVTANGTGNSASDARFGNVSLNVFSNI